MHHEEYTTAAPPNSVCSVEAFTAARLKNDCILSALAGSFRCWRRSQSGPDIHHGGEKTALGLGGGGKYSDLTRILKLYLKRNSFGIIRTSK